jgi:hypothetical protein
VVVLTAIPAHDHHVSRSEDDGNGLHIFCMGAEEKNGGVSEPVSSVRPGSVGYTYETEMSGRKGSSLGSSERRTERGVLSAVHMSHERVSHSVEVRDPAIWH